MTIQEIVRFHRNKWIQSGDFGMPDLKDCLDFMVCEAGEAIDARLRLDPKYVRNNEKDSAIYKIALELFDVIMMACTALDILGFDLMDIARDKLHRMDVKRSIEE